MGLSLGMKIDEHGNAIPGSGSQSPVIAGLHNYGIDDEEEEEDETPGGDGYGGGNF